MIARYSCLVLLLIMPAVFVGAGCGGEQKPAEKKEAAVKKPKYHCPMHPTVVSDQKGTCPICFMDLELIDGADSKVSSTAGGLAEITVSSETRQKMGVKLGTVEKRKLIRTIRTSARIAADETRLYRVNPKIGGWVEKLHVSVTGQSVKKGDPLLTIYSPEMVASEQEYLSALQAFRSAGRESMAAASNMLSAVKMRFDLWDISPEQIERIEKTGQVEKFLTLTAPAGGWVLEKNVTAGQKISAGDSLLVIADLSTVWGDADVHESDLPFVRIGTPVQIKLQSWPDRSFTGKVSFLSPSVNTQTRTLKARVEILNPDAMLKIEMYADAMLTQDLGEKLAVPELAVMRTAEKVYVFRDGGEGKLVPVEIRIGPRCDGYFEVLAGLAEGDKVVTSANFLVDSESSLKAALQSLGDGGK
ncbi:MAG: efflux RND transporter periplasmic adaptor subunit [Verrucomicrobia bacterium]|nr:efflux RND transporter periplasmic adaptor subunit [Verrucomicrobiota bacterium]